MLFSIDLSSYRGCSITPDRYPTRLFLPFALVLAFVTQLPA